MSIIMSVITTVSPLRSGTSNSLSQLNSGVASWTTKHKDNHSSTSIFDENIGEDGLSFNTKTAEVLADNVGYLSTM